MEQHMTLVVGMIGTWISVAIAAFLSSRFSHDRERRLALWSKEIDRIFEVEELAGVLLEEVGSYRSLEESKDRIYEQLGRLETAAGRMGRYPGIRQAIRDFVNLLNRLIRDRLTHEDDRETRHEIEPAYRALLDASDREFGKRKL